MNHQEVNCEIVSDRDARFTSAFWNSLTDYLGVSRLMSTPYHPQTNGACERLNQTLIQMLRCLSCNLPNTPWPNFLPFCEMVYNNTKVAKFIKGLKISHTIHWL